MNNHVSNHHSIAANPKLPSATAPSTLSCGDGNVIDGEARIRVQTRQTARQVKYNLYESNVIETRRQRARKCLVSEEAEISFDLAWRSKVVNACSGGMFGERYDRTRVTKKAACNGNRKPLTICCGPVMVDGLYDSPCEQTSLALAT